jgi:hypothetical protein
LDQFNKIKATKNNNFNFGRSKQQLSKWIKLKEFKPFLVIVLWVCQVEQFSKPLSLLMARILKLVKSHGFNFTFQYLKIALHCTIMAYNNTPLFEVSQPRVKRDAKGFPTVIPRPLRNIIIDRSNVDHYRITKAVFTVLSIFRTFATKVKPSMDNLILPFNGLARELNYSELAKVLKDMRIYSLRYRPFYGFISESAGPNGKKATWTSGIDAFAFIENPRQLYYFSRLALATKSYDYLIWLYIILIISGPFYLIFRLLGLLDPSKLGKLSIVYDQPGKARVVAITNWWIQLALLPLHDCIFDKLREIPQDGTMNQDLALNNLIANYDPEHKFYSFDLSAATDRLPIDVQVQILRLLKVDSLAWKGLLDFAWFYKGEYIKYSVGQPMGAYSSWAMLALTHHVIVNLAARRAGLSNFTKYALLGDDIVINHDKVAEHYKIIMSTLGVSINLSKSLISNDLVEFAKRWKGPSCDISPLGAGNILASIRQKYFIGSVFTEALRKEFFLDGPTLRSTMEKYPKAYAKVIYSAMWASMGILDSPVVRRQLSASALNCYVLNRVMSQDNINYCLWHGLYPVILDKISRSVESISKQDAEFHSKWFSTVVSKNRYYAFLEQIFRIITPSFWLYYLSFARDYDKALKEYASYTKMYIDSDSYYSPTILLNLPQFPNGLSIDWRDRKAVKDLSKFYNKLEISYLRAVNGISPFEF